MVEASRDETCLAVRLDNDPAEVRASLRGLHRPHAPSFPVPAARSIHPDNLDHRYWQRDNPRRLEKIDGEPKR